MPLCMMRRCGPVCANCWTFLPTLCDDVAKQCATLPLVLGGLGLRSAVRTRVPAHWASWADCFPTVKARHPEVAACMVEGLQTADNTVCLRAAAHAAEELARIPGFEPPSWEALADGARPPACEPDQYEPGCHRAGWQHEGSARPKEAFRESLFAAMTDSERETRGGSSVVRVPHVRHHTGGSPSLPHVALPPSPSPLASVQAQLPVWPSTRLSWPPPRSMRQGGGAGEERLRCRECCRQDLPQGRSKSGDEHVGPRHGPGCSKPE